MRFVVVIHHGTYPLPGTPEAETVSAEDRKAAYAEWAAINAMENVTGGPPLGLPKDATTIRVENGSTVRSEGPFVDAPSAVGGFMEVEVEDLDAAVAIAARIPQARLGGAIGQPVGLAHRSHHPVVKAHTNERLDTSDVTAVVPTVARARFTPAPQPLRPRPVCRASPRRGVPR